MSAANDEYRHLRLSGHFLYDLTTPVQAVTARGTGFWLLTPLCQPDGTVVLINRGFIPGTLGGDSGYPARRAGADACASVTTAPVTLSGLLRLSEPKGGFLRTNDAARQRWFSRDVAAIGAARGFSTVAPFFVDADGAQPGLAAAQEPVAPIGGMTVIVFPNNHMVYALTWFALAAMVGAAWWWIARMNGGATGRRDDDRA